jgi:hypothetical protein
MNTLAKIANISLLLLAALPFVSLYLANVA